MKNLKVLVASLILLHSTSLLAVDEGFTDYSLTLEKLKRNPSAKFSQQSGWSIVSLSEDDSRIIWFFSPKENAAHPYVIKKTISVKDGGTETVITSLCDAGKKKCDDLISQFKVINEDYK